MNVLVCGTLWSVGIGTAETGKTAAAEEIEIGTKNTEGDGNA